MSGEDAGKATVYHDRFLNYARSLCGDVSMAEDLVQNAYLKVVEYEKPVQNLCSFTMSIIHYKFLDIERARQRSRIVDTLPLDGDKIVAPKKSEDISLIVMKTMATLPEIYRNVLADFTDGLSYKEIARKEGINPGMTRVRICRARRMLSEYLAESPLETNLPALPRKDVA